MDQSCLSLEGRKEAFGGPHRNNPHLGPGYPSCGPAMEKWIWVEQILSTHYIIFFKTTNQAQKLYFGALNKSVFFK